MRSRWTAALSAIAMLALAPSLASASDEAVQQQLQQMQNRMQQMEDKLQATTDQLESANQRVDEQSQLIEQSGLAETRGASNGLPGFLGQITVGGWVAASYLWNINHPTSDTNLGYPTGPGMGGTNAGLNDAFYPLHPDHNSFALDQVWFEIERPINEENRAGFRFDTVYGKTAALLNGGGPNNRYSNLRRFGALHPPGLRPVPRADWRRRDVQGWQVRDAVRVRGGGDDLQPEHHARQRVEPARADRSHWCDGRLRVRRHRLRRDGRRGERVPPERPGQQRVEVHTRSRRVGERDAERRA